MKQILVRPIITEKSVSGAENRKYVFEVHNDANKIEIEKSVHEYYKVDPTQVNIVKVKGKEKRFKGRNKGTTKNWKKAIVTVKKGQKIEGFDIKEENNKKK
jgi:large subunit ribosomal protein L23